MKTSYGLEFEIMAPEEIERFDGYDRCVAECDVANCGKIIVDQYGMPIDNEYDLEEIYTIIKSK